MQFDLSGWGFCRETLSAFLGGANMEKKPKIAQYRERLDKTLASPELTNEETLKMLVKNQLMHSSLDGNEGQSF